MKQRPTNILVRKYNYEIEAQSKKIEEDLMQN